jgi:catechol 2,3-dioxygenase-like lactoylglutathione lyase family enzyme
MEGLMLDDALVEATVPVARLSRAREFYEGVLGLSPGGSHRPDVDVFYVLGGGTRLALIEELEPMRPPRSAAHFVVEDVDATVRELRARGVEFDEFDLPRLKTVDGVATVGERRFAWFKDPDNNVLAIHD